MLDSLTFLMNRDLRRVISEVNAYSAEANLWLLDAGINNTAGNLALHLCGNLQHFIGATLGKSGYVRKRDEEFSRTNVPRTEIVDELEITIKMISNTLPYLNLGELQNIFPIKVFKEETSTESFLLHLSTHLNYHLGQINYHRRLLDK